MSDKISNQIRTRFAPSPTGSVHVGNARNAIYEYLFAKKNQGDFLLRIEDTNQKRYDKEAIDKIYEMLKWFGINWDDDVMIQSSRIALYKDYAHDLVEKGKAYFCFCSEGRLEKIREEQNAKGMPTCYDRKCRNISAEEVLENIKNNVPHVIRLKVPESGKLIFQDIVRGKIEFDYKDVDDQVLLKSDGFPTYHLASVVDDHDQGITHVIRSDEWLSSVPKHLFLYECFGWQSPEFAHLSLILGKDKKKLSKREGSTSVEEFKALGYLPEALLNFIVLLGWNPGDDREFFTVSELKKEFDLEKINKAPAMFDIEKLNHFNAHYIHQMSDEELLEKIKPFSQINFSDFDNNYLQKVILITKTRMVLLTDFDVNTRFLFEDVNIEKEMVKFVKSDWQNTSIGLSKAIEKLESFDDWNSVESLNAVLLDVVAENGLKNGDVFWPVRVALSGEMASPSPTELLWVLGRDESLKRLRNAFNIIK